LFASSIVQGGGNAALGPTATEPSSSKRTLRPQLP
jgi:hypothetical protein